MPDKIDFTDPAERKRLREIVKRGTRETYFPSASDRRQMAEDRYQAAEVLPVALDLIERLLKEPVGTTISDELRRIPDLQEIVRHREANAPDYFCYVSLEDARRLIDGWRACLLELMKKEVSESTDRQLIDGRLNIDGWLNIEKDAVYFHHTKAEADAAANCTRLRCVHVREVDG